MVRFRLSPGYPGGIPGLESTRFCLKKENILSFFHGIVTGQDVKQHKPDPEGIYRAMEQMNTSPQETLVVGDAGADILAGKSAGTFTALARWADVEPAYDLPSQPDFTFSIVQQLRAFLLPEAEDEFQL